MSQGIAFDTKEQVRQAIDIVELVGQYMPLRRQGRVYTGLCPWHDDTKPSLQVNPERQTFKCWVCDIGGDVFSFMMRREGVEFSEALSMLAERAGIPLQSRGPRDQGSPATANSKQTLFRAAAWAESEYHRCLLSDAAAEPARRYLAERQITDESIRRFHLGFAPESWSWLIERARGTEFTTQDLERIGLAAISPTTKRHYDRFRGRVLFSIRDTQDRPIATGGRILPQLADDRAAKYINSPETPLFSKSNQLYGLNVARQAIQDARHAVVMEGYTDCIAAQQSGLQNVVAVLGTALGPRHVQLLSRYADTVTLVLDGDEAGQRRANEILDLFVASPLDLRVLTLPDRLDPCDFVLQQGLEQFQTVLDEAVDALDHKVQVATRGIDPADGSHAANRALEDILQTVAKAPPLRAGGTTQSGLREEQFLARMARRFHVDERTLRDRLAALRKRGSRRPKFSDTNAASHAKPAIADSWEREFIEILLQQPEAISRIAEEIGPEQLTDTVCRRIYARCVELSAAGITADFDRLILEFDDPALKSLLVQLDERGRDRGGSDLAQQLPDVLDSFRRRHDSRRGLATVAALREHQFDETEEVSVLEQLVEKERTRHQLK
ncbi:MAG: DNA primase [Planctomycetota bacterium]|nr:DNA primase [Planctomycetota bacterium]